MINYSYILKFRGECCDMDPERDTFARILAKTEEQFTGGAPRLTAHDREELQKVWLEELSAARVRASEKKAP